jgi:hypothetical protein
MGGAALGFLLRVVWYEQGTGEVLGRGGVVCAGSGDQDGG